MILNQFRMGLRPNLKSSNQPRGSSAEHISWTNANTFSIIGPNGAESVTVVVATPPNKNSKQIKKPKEMPLVIVYVMNDDKKMIEGWLNGTQLPTQKWQLHHRPVVNGLGDYSNGSIELWLGPNDSNTVITTPRHETRKYASAQSFQLRLNKSTHNPSIIIFCSVALLVPKFIPIRILFWPEHIIYWIRSSTIYIIFRSKLFWVLILHWSTSESFRSKRVTPYKPFV